MDELCWGDGHVGPSSDVFGGDQAITTLTMGRNVTSGAGAPAGIVGATWALNYDSWAAADSHSSVTRNPPSTGPAA